MRLSVGERKEPNELFIYHVRSVTATPVCHRVPILLLYMGVFDDAVILGDFGYGAAKGRRMDATNSPISFREELY